MSVTKRITFNRTRTMPVVETLLVSALAIAASSVAGVAGVAFTYVKWKMDDIMNTVRRRTREDLLLSAKTKRNLDVLIYETRCKTREIERARMDMSQIFGAVPPAPTPVKHAGYSKKRDSALAAELSWRLEALADLQCIVDSEKHVANASAETAAHHNDAAYFTDVSSSSSYPCHEHTTIIKELTPLGGTASFFDGLTTKNASMTSENNANGEESKKVSMSDSFVTKHEASCSVLQPSSTNNHFEA